MALPFVGCFRGWPAATGSSEVDDFLPPCPTLFKLVRESHGATAGGKGSSPVLVGLMYDISVEEEPSPGVFCGDLSMEMSFSFDDARLDGRGGSADDMTGSDATVFKDLLVSTGFVKGLLGEIEPRAASGEYAGWSIVRDLRIGIGFGEVGVEAGLELVDATGCQRSRTDDFLGAARA